MLYQPNELEERLSQLGHGGKFCCPTWTKELPDPGCHCIRDITAHIADQEATLKKLREYEERTRATICWDVECHHQAEALTKMAAREEALDKRWAALVTEVRKDERLKSMAAVMERAIGMDTECRCAHLPGQKSFDHLMSSIQRVCNE